jgi:hypothetical protein
MDGWYMLHQIVLKRAHTRMIQGRGQSGNRAGGVLKKKKQKLEGGDVNGRE